MSNDMQFGELTIKNVPGKDEVIAVYRDDDKLKEFDLKSQDYGYSNAIDWARDEIARGRAGGENSIQN